MAMSAGSVATWVFSRMTGITSSVSGNMITLASGAIIDINNFMGTTADCTNVPTEQFNVAVNLTALYARVAMDGGAVAFKMDGLEMTKGLSPQAEFFKEQVNMALKRKKILYAKVYG